MNTSEFSNDLGRFAEIADAVCQRLAKNLSVRRTLPGKGRIRMDRQLPFLCVYRSPQAMNDLGTRELVTSEAAYLFASGEPQYLAGINELCQRVGSAMQEHFGTFLFIEVWARTTQQEEELPLLKPAFEIVTDRRDSIAATVDALTAALSDVTIGEHQAVVACRKSDGVVPPGLPSVTYNSPDNGQQGGFALGLAVRPIYRDDESDTLFPLVLQSLRAQLAPALRKAAATFAGLKDTEDAIHFEALGPTSHVKASGQVDQQLSDVSNSFDFLLQVTPTNSDQAWEYFENSGYQSEPALSYRPLPYNPSLLKRRLFDIEIERMEDPTLSQLFWEKQEELERQLTALRDLNTPHFLYDSLQLYGGPDESLVRLARRILSRYPKSNPPVTANGFVKISEVAQRAHKEIDHYRRLLPEFDASVEVCDHIASGIMVSRNRLLISESLQIRPRRLLPLLHHEVGTHLVTYFNGQRQPFRQLHAGLAGYDTLQEGLSILAEYLSHGLTRNRLRGLAGRVIAVQMMVKGESFVETFDRLHEKYDFSDRQAFVTTLRAFRGGGLTKDIIYLRGLRDVLNYLKEGHDIEPLYVGKFGLQHLQQVRELRRRGIIEPPGVLPRFLDDPDVRDRLEACRGLSVLELVENDA